MSDKMKTRTLILPLYEDFVGMMAFLMIGLFQTTLLAINARQNDISFAEG